jgi:hypothetical protein
MTNEELFPGYVKPVPLKPIGVVVWSGIWAWRKPVQVFLFKPTKATRKWGPEVLAGDLAALLDVEYTLTDDPRGIADENHLHLIYVTAIEEHHKIRFIVW